MQWENRMLTERDGRGEIAQMGNKMGDSLGWHVYIKEV